MRRWLAAALVVALAIVVAWLLWPRRGVVDRPDNVVSRRAHDRTLAPPRDRGPVLDWQAATLGGLVLDATTGAPIAGATVSLSEKDAQEHARYRAGRVGEPRVTRTDAAGRFRFDGLPGLGYRVHASARGMLTAHAAVTLAAGQTSDVTLRLAAGGAPLTGRVTDVGGGPVGGAFVRAAPLLLSWKSFEQPDLVVAVTDEQGEYALSVAPGRYTVVAEHAEYVSASNQAIVPAAGTRVDLVLTPGGRIAGRVLSRTDDSPVPGAHVTWSGDQATGQEMMGVDLLSILGGVLTDAEGRFVTPRIGSGDIQLKAYARGYVSLEPTHVALGLAEEQNDVTVWVERGFSISGRVVEFEDPSKPVPGVTVGALRMQGFEPRLGEGPSDADGTFEILGLTPGTYFVATVGDDIVTNFITNMVGVVDRDVTDVELRVSRGVSVRGRVEPPQPAHVTLEVDMGDSPSITGALTVMSALFVRTEAGPDGTFELRAVPRGKLVVLATTDDGKVGRTSIEVGTKSVDGVIVKLESQGTVEGIVVDTRGRPQAGVDVEIRPDSEVSIRISGDNFNNELQTDARGRFERRGLVAGRYSVSAEPGKSVDFALGERETKHVRVEIEARDGVIRGRVIDDTGAPVPDAWVSGEADMVVRPVLTGGDGGFELTGLQDRPHTVRATGPSGTARATATDVKPGARIELRLQVNGSVNGRVTQGGAPVPNYTLELDGPSDRDRRVSNADGRFDIQGLEAGHYKVEVVSDAGETKAEVDVTAGQPASLELELAGWGSITGRLVDAEAKPIGGVFAHASNQSEEEVITSFLGLKKSKTGGDGRFRIDKIKSGEGTVFFVDEKFGVVATRKYTLEPGQALDIGDVVGVAPDHKERDERGWLGMELDDDDGKLVVREVTPGGPAAAAGVKKDDVILAAGPHRVEAVGPAAVESFLDRYTVAGTPVELELARGKVTVTPANLPSQ